MKLALPAPPRKVRLAQVPGARVRVVLVALLGALAVFAITALGVQRVGAFTLARAEQTRWVVVSGVVASIERGEVPTATALYELAGRQYSGDRIALAPEHADLLREGAVVKLQVDPARPERAVDPLIASERVRQARLEAIGTVALALLMLFTAVWAVLGAARRERLPLREGLLIWLTPDAPPESRRSVRGHYFRQDVRYEVRARVRPGEAPIRNGEKVLAAVAPPRRHAIVIDERLAKALGWLGE